MNENKIYCAYMELCFSPVFISVLEKPLFKRFFDYAKCEVSDEKRILYSRFVNEIYESELSLAALVAKCVFEDENAYIRKRAKGDEIAPSLDMQTLRELRAFERFASLEPSDFAFDMGVRAEDIPHYENEKIDFLGEYEARIRSIGKHGYGIFSSYGMFRLSDSLEIEPIVSRDKVNIESFIGYEEQRELIAHNTLAFINGLPAANALLTGDAGTGKSSTVKAVANAYFSEGVRLIELRKDQLHALPLVMARINGNPLKFIIFIDDLSFNKNDDNFSMLKAALEGSASALSDNAIIYATSNRRHIIKESFAERDAGDDIHRNDTVQETLSLSERFGLTVLFSKPDKKLYLKITKTLAERYGLDVDDGELEIGAEAFALRKGSRSARCAEQYVKGLVARSALEGDNNADNR